MDVGTNQVFVRQVQPRCCHSAGYHALWTFEEVLVMRATGAAIAVDKCWLAATTSPPAPLRIVCWRWWYVSQVDHVQVSNIDTELHRGTAIENAQPPCAEIIFALLPL